MKRDFFGNEKPKLVIKKLKLGENNSMAVFYYSKEVL